MSGIKKDHFLNLLKFVLFSCALFLCFFKLSSHPIQQWDELTNINVVKESLDSDNPLILKYNGSPFFEKPPLWYWLSAGMTKIFGETIFNFRLVSAISGVFLTWLVYKIGKDFWGEIAGITAGFSVLAAGHLFINNVSGYFSTHNFRSADLDALQILFMIIAFWYFYCGINARKKFDISKYFAVSFLFSGLAVMVKGFFGFFPIISGLCFLIIQNICNRRKTDVFSIFERIFKAVFCYFFCNFREIINKFIPKFFSIISEKFSRPKISAKTFILPTIVLLLTILPWHLFMTLIFGREFTSEYFLYHIVKRATQAIESHSESFSFYFQMLFNSKVFVSGALLFVGIFAAILKKKFMQDFRRFGIVFNVLFPLFIFTLIPTKLAWYNLYIYPFAALIIGFLAQAIFESDEKMIRVFGTAIVSFYLISGLARNFLWVLKL